MLRLTCDILVVGGGVAGLAAALASSKSGLDTILIEKEAEIGYKIRGEVIKKQAPIFLEIFGPELPEKVIVNDLLRRRIYSPSTAKYIDVNHTEATVTMDYRTFILELFKKLSKTTCKIFLNTKLVQIEKDVQITHVICEKDEKQILISATYFIGADGANSKFATFLEQGSEREIYPALKLNYENLKIPDSHRIELYLMVDPPGAMWMFPKSESSAECGIVAWTHDLPKDFDIMEFWTKKTKEHQILNKILTDAKCYYISRDFLNFGGPLKNIFGQNFVVVGDSGGHIGSIGGSGIISSMDVGFGVTEFIAKALQLEGRVTEGMITEFLNRFNKSPIQKFLKNEQKLGKLFREILFQNFKTIEVIDENWYKLENIYSVRKTK